MLKIPHKLKIIRRLGIDGNRSVVTQGNQKVSVHLTITVQSSGAQRLFDHPVVSYETEWSTSTL